MKMSEMLKFCRLCILVHCINLNLKLPLNMIFRLAHNQQVKIQKTERYFGMNLHVHRDAIVIVSSLTSLVDSKLASSTSGTVLYRSKIILEGIMVGFGNLELIESTMDFSNFGKYEMNSMLLININSKF